ncbi:MAG TPA: hypothetical protein VJN18_27110 [Polyangiaceae bacterium]|nr:hypothetical protein [Polyangiaceae bacterium]
MQAVKAHVRNGYFVSDEPANLPEGTEVELQLVTTDSWADMDPEETRRARRVDRRRLPRHGERRPHGSPRVHGSTASQESVRVEISKRAQRSIERIDVRWRKQADYPEIFRVEMHGFRLFG